MYNFDRRNQREDKILERVNKANIITQWNELNVLPIYKTIPQIHKWSSLWILYRFSHRNVNRLKVKQKCVVIMQVDIPLSVSLYRWAVGEERWLSLSDVRHVAPELWRSLCRLRRVAERARLIALDPRHTPDQREHMVSTHYRYTHCSVTWHSLCHFDESLVLYLIHQYDTSILYTKML